MGIKSAIQKSIHEKHLKKYLEEVKKQEDAYQSYIDYDERKECGHLITVREASAQSENVLVLTYDEFNEDYMEGRANSPFLLLVNGEGLISYNTVETVERVFEDYPDTNVIYFDEDVVDKETGKRSNPWFKAGWSLDSLLESFYMGNVVALRGSCLNEAMATGDKHSLANVYKSVIELTKEEPAIHIAEVMFHCFEDSTNQVLGADSSFEYIRKDGYKYAGADASFAIDERGISHGILKSDGQLISIIIPSKDHPDILDRCVSSIRRLSTYKNIEIIVVDNGSGDAKKAYEAMAVSYNYSYIYEVMDFNFSKMCNIGANASKGEFLLFLNDDMEIITKDWLEKLLGTATLKHVGAVGAKLLYPDSDLIQHIGITNMTEGPAHKLQRHSDGKCYYHGVNLVNRDVIGVTAACLMLERSKFDEIGGFFEGLAVAYNDVDLCFALIGEGYYNVQRNDVLLYHHESLSRGDDAVSPEKMKRLENERIILYSRFPGFYGMDDFYSMHLTGAGEEYVPVLPYENRNIKPIRAAVNYGFSKGEVNETLIVRVDKAAVEPISVGGGLNVLIDLHAHVRGLDSSDYTYKMFIKNGEFTMELPVVRRIRPDVVETYKDQIHVELSGFAVRVPVKLLIPGEFEIWMEAKSILSRQVLLNKGDKGFVIKEEMFGAKAING